MLFGCALAPHLTLAASSDVFISEVGWGGSTLSASDEYLELTNRSSTPVSLANWYLSEAATAGEALSFPEDAVIEPHSTYLIANYATDEPNSTLATTPDFVTSRLSLKNTALAVALVDDAGVVRDHAGDGVGANAHGQVGVSMERLFPDLDGSLDEAWEDATGSQGFKDGLPDLGTPGFSALATASNTPPSEPVEVSTSGDSLEEIDSAPEALPSESPALEEEPSQEESTPSEEPATQVFPMEFGSRPNIITVIYQGYVFELNLPDQEAVTNTVGASASLSSTETNLPQESETTSAPPSSEDEPALSVPDITIATSSDTTTTTEPPTSEPATSVNPVNEAIMSLQTLRFSEVYPNTVGSDEEEEYIELENYGDASIDLFGWSITDASEKTWTADGHFTLGAGDVLALPRVTTKITLNNSNETITLRHPNEQVIDVLSYGTSPKGKSYTRHGDTWTWDAPSPNTLPSPVTAEVTVASSSTSEEASVTLEVPPVSISTDATATEPSSSELPAGSLDIPSIVLQSSTQPPTTSSGSGSSLTPSTSSLISIHEARQAPLGSSVTTEGTVVSLPGTFASQSFYLQNDAGIQVYLNSAEFPELHLGDHIRVHGVTSQNKGEARVKIASGDDLTVLSAGEVATTTVLLSDVGEAFEGQLVAVEGVVESARSTELTLTAGEHTLRVVARDRTGISFASIESGNRVRITGIVSESNGTYSLLPRTADDVVILESSPDTQSPLLSGTITVSSPPTKWYGLALLTASVSLLGFWFLRTRTEPPLAITHA